jgi:hypothetical protein
MKKLRRIVYVSRKGTFTAAFYISVGKDRRRMRDKIKTGLNGIGCENIKWVQLARHMD